MTCSVPNCHLFLRGNDCVLHGTQNNVQAVPHVVGAAALLKAADPGFHLSKTRKVLLDSAARLPALQGKCKSGGKLDVGAALKEVLRLRKERWKTTRERQRVSKFSQDRRLKR